MGSRFAAGMLALLLALPAWPQSAGTMLDGVKVSRRGDSARLELRFACRNRYVDHFPLTRAKRVRISLAEVDRCALSSTAAPRRDLRRPRGREAAFLREVEFVRAGDGDGSLLLHFEQPVTVTVQQGGDFSHLVVDVDVTGVVPTAPVVAEPPVAAPPAAAVERVEERARRATALAFADPEVSPGDYAINLESALEAIDPARIEAGRFPDDLHLYATQIVVGERTWHRLRLGFFATERDAERVLATMRSAYPDGWVVRVASGEQDIALNNPVSPPPAVAADTIEPEPADTGGDGLSDEELDALAAEGRAAMLAGDNGRAVQIYTRMLREPEHEHSRSSLEYLGLSRERHGQTAHAVSQYRRYLMLYPDGDDAARVRQRLAGLVALDEAPAAPAQARREAAAPRRWDIYGGIAQYYRLDQSQFGSRDSVTGQSSVLTDLDVVARRRGDRFDMSSRATLGNLYDFLNDGPGNSTRVYYLYADVVDAHTDTSVRLGRQSQHSSGVLGRFDGAQASWQWRPETRLNFVTGFPVDSSVDSIDTDRFFYGVSADLTGVMDLFDLNLFYNTQQVDGIDDRQAIGAELHYYDDVRSLISLFDYDFSYGEINSFVVMGNWAFANRVTVNGLIDLRKSPFLTTRNALIGQSVTTVGELVDSLGGGAVRRLAADRTGDSYTYSLGVSSPLFDRFQINADVTMTSYSGTPASGGVPAIPEISGDIYYSLNLIGSGLLLDGDTSIFTLGYVDGSSASTLSLAVDARYPLYRRLRVNPRMRISLRETARTQTDQWIAAPSLRLLYRFARRYQLEMEVGGEWSSQKTAGDSFTYNTYFIYAGYRADF